MEIGAGTAVPTIRWTSEMLIQEFPQGKLIRINPNEPAVPDSIMHACISLPLKGLETLRKIDELLKDIK